MKMRYLGLFALAPLAAQCQPACTPTPPAPVATTTTVEATTTTTAATTTAPNLNPLNIRFDGFACDESQTMSGWTSFLAVVVRHDGPVDADVTVLYETPEGPSALTQAPLVDLNPGDPVGLGWVPWPRTEAGGHVFWPNTRVRVSYQGDVILEQTFTLDDVRRDTPACIAVIDTPGVYD